MKDYTVKIPKMTSKIFKEEVNKILSESLIKLFFNFASDEERVEAIREFADGMENFGITYKDDKDLLTGIDTMVLEIIDANGLDDVLESARYHAFYTAFNEDYLGSYFSITVFSKDYPDGEATIIANDLIDFWIAAGNDSIVIFPYKCARLNDMLCEYFTSGDGKIAETYHKKVVA